MALKDIFTMIKADRYTADGCEEIKKAQEAIKEETADAGLPDGTMRHRKDGDYIKQAGKWVPAKKGNGGAKKADKPNSNGVVAQQKQKMETEKHEAARRDAQAPSKKTEVNTPGLRKDVQEAIKRSSPEEIKAYIKELRTPGSRMSRYFDNPDLLANVYEDELKKATESKPEKGSKEDVKQRLGAYVKAMNKKNGEFAGRSKKLGESSEQRAQERLAELNRASAESKPAAGSGSAPSANQSELLAKKRQWDAEGGPANEAERAEYDKLRSQIVYKLPDEKSSFSTDVNRMKKLKEQDPREFSVQLEKLHSKYNTNKWNDLYRKISQDAAPRQLTGDCKVRIKKS
jgi:hypothetical protein